MLPLPRHYGLLTLLLLSCLAGCAQPGSIAIEKTAATEQEALQQPSKAETLLLKAETAFKNVDYQNAKSFYADYLALGDKVPDETYYRYGYALNRTGDYLLAIEQFERFLARTDQQGAFFTNAQRELSFARMEQTRLEELERKNAEEKARQDRLLTVRQAIAAVPDSEIQGLIKAIQNRVPKIVEPFSGMELLLVKGGCYQRGDYSENSNNVERLRHEVCVSDFYIGQYEVTQGQWQKVMGYNPSHFQKGDNYPVESIAWVDAQSFLELLSLRIKGFRLPTEAEWEYAARSGGKQEQFSGSDNADAVAWSEENSGLVTHPVGQKKANGLGLYDMSGNVAEWCLDYMSRDFYAISPKENPTGPVSVKKERPRRVSRGGSFREPSEYTSTSYRGSRFEVDSHDNDQGFRVALPLTRDTLEPVSDFQQ